MKRGSFFERASESALAKSSSMKCNGFAGVLAVAGGVVPADAGSVTGTARRRRGSAESFIKEES
jgi:hypothetical protein